MMKIKKLIAGGLSLLLSLSAIIFLPEYSPVAYAATPPDIASQAAALYNANTGIFFPNFSS